VAIGNRMEYFLKDKNLTEETLRDSLIKGLNQRELAQIIVKNHRFLKILVKIIVTKLTQCNLLKWIKTRLFSFD
jgi:hypothetical protein